MGKPILYTHSVQGSMLEMVDTRTNRKMPKDTYGMIGNSGRSLQEKMRRLDAFRWEVHDFWEDD